MIAPDGLLATKLYMPRPRPGLVFRPRLESQLDLGLAQGVILVCAPAGFGKTALLADWAQRGRRPVVWLSVDAGDNDPGRFWRHVAAALDKARPGIAEQAWPLLGPPPPPSFERLITALINELAAQPGDEVVLVLDDYHLISARPVHASLTFLLEHRPPELCLVLACRADPPLPLARLRGRGQLAELRAADLRFTEEEAGALLREAAGPGVSLPGPAVATLAARTEGWAAGLQLAALSLRGQADVAGFVAAFSGSHHYVLDYLADEVLEVQPEHLRSFLLETSVLERLSGGLCDAVTGQADGQRMLEQAERANLFLVPLDETRGWWRYHHLFADLLRARLQQEQPGRVPQLHRNAAAWCDEHGLADDAVRHALAAGDATWAARLAERHADILFTDSLLRLSAGATLQRWLAALPAEVLRSRPRLMLLQAVLAALSGRVYSVEAQVDAAERAWAAAAGEEDEHFEPSVGRAASSFTNVPALIAAQRAVVAERRGDIDRAIAFGQRALDELGESDTIAGRIVRDHLAIAEWMRGRTGEAERAASASVGRWRAIGEPFLAVRACQVLGLVQRAQGRLDAALGTYQQALEISAAPGRPAVPPAGIAHVGMAEVAYQRDELDEALQHLAEGIALCRQLAYTPPLAAGLATLAWIRQAEGDPAGALDAIEQAKRAAPDVGVTALLNPVPAQGARLLLAWGDVGAAARWAERRGIGADDEPRYQREPEYLVLARVLLAQGLPGLAAGLLERLRSAAAAQGRTGSVIEVRALQALALAAGGEEESAVAALAEALSLAWPQRYVRVFADEGAPMGALLGRLISAQRTDTAAVRGVPLDCLARLARAFDREAARAGTPGASHAAAGPGLVEALSERELEVLQLLAAGKQNREIAEELVVALNTVKKHITHIFQKLGAANRTEATTRARELGLLLLQARQLTTAPAPATQRRPGQPNVTAGDMRRCHPATTFGYRPAGFGAQDTTPKRHLQVTTKPAAAHNVQTRQEKDRAAAKAARRHRGERCSRSVLPSRPRRGGDSTGADTPARG